MAFAAALKQTSEIVECLGIFPILNRNGAERSKSDSLSFSSNAILDIAGCSKGKEMQAEIGHCHVLKKGPQSLELRVQHFAVALLLAIPISPLQRNFPRLVIVPELSVKGQWMLGSCNLDLHLQFYWRSN
jgi:hypothetical protein